MMHTQTHDHYALIQKPDSEKLVVLFSGANTTSGKFTFWKVAQSIDHNILFINNGRNEWYQHGIPGLGSTVEEVSASIGNLAKLVGAKEIYTMGASMGAYAAILYAPFLNASALAFGPETVISMPFSRCATHMVKDVAIRFPQLKPVIASARKPIILVAGETDAVDFFSAAQLAGEDRVCVKTIRRIGHMVPKLLAQRDQFVPLLRAFIENQPLPKLPREGSAHLVEGLPEAFYEGFRAFWDKDWARASDNAVWATELLPTFEPAQLLAAQAFTHAGQHEKAYLHYAVASALDPTSIHRHLDFGVCLGRLGHTAEALVLLQQLAGQRPDFALAHFHVGLLHLQRKSHHKGKVEIFRAANLVPNDKFITTYAQRFGWKKSDA